LGSDVPLKEEGALVGDHRVPADASEPLELGRVVRRHRLEASLARAGDALPHERRRHRAEAGRVPRGGRDERLTLYVDEVAGRGRV